MLRTASRRRAARLLIPLLATPVVAGCPTDGPVGEGQAMVVIGIDPIRVTVEVGEEAELRASMFPDNDPNGLRWFSEDNGVATVTPQQVPLATVFGIAPGETRIRANGPRQRNAGVSELPPPDGRTDVTVTARPLAVSMQPQELNLEPGQSGRLACSVTHVRTGAAIGDVPLQWRSSDAAVAVVDQDGNVTGVGAGIADVVCTVTGGEASVSAAAIAVVRVTAPAPFLELTVGEAAGNGQIDFVNTLLPQALALGSFFVVRNAPPSSPGTCAALVRWDVRSGGGRAEPVSSVSAPGSPATTQWTLGPGEGDQAVAAVIEGPEATCVVPNHPPQEVAFTARAIRPRLDPVNGDGQVQLVGTLLNAPLVAALTTGPDGERLRRAGLSVRFVIESGDGTIEPATAVTDEFGEVQAQYTLGFAAGEQVVRAELVDFTDAVPARFTEVAAVPDVVVAGGDGQEGEVSLPLAGPLVARLMFNGSTVEQALWPVEFAVVSGAGSVAPASVVTDENGMARSTFTLGPEPGEHVARARLIGAPPAAPDARFTAIANRGPSAEDLAGRFAGTGTARVNGCNMSPTGTFAPTILVGPEAGQLTWRSFLDLVGIYQRLLGRLIAQASTMSGPIRITEKVDGEFSRVNPPADMRPRFRGDLTFEQENTQTGARCETTFEIDVIRQ
jgi:hypothetical protein